MWRCIVAWLHWRRNSEVRREREALVRTQDLVRVLVKDLPDGPRDRRWQPAVPLLLALLLSGVVVGAIIVLFLAPNPHVAHGPDLTTTVTVIAALSLTGCAFRLSLLMQRPEARIRLGLLAWPVLFLLIGVVIELLQHPASTWTSRLLGEDPLSCFLLVSGLSIPVLVAALGVLRRGAPAEPALLGTMAGLLAAGVTSTLYVLHCPEPSLLYITAWHVPAVLLVGSFGARLGCWWLRW